MSQGVLDLHKHHKTDVKFRVDAPQVASAHPAVSSLKVIFQLHEIRQDKVVQKQL